MAKMSFTKRIIATFMVLVLCVSMVPLYASAHQVMDGYFVLDENGNVLSTTNETSRTEDGFTVSKTATHKSGNEFEITLEVQTSQTVVTSDAAIVLVIDNSSSMEHCAECGSSNCRNNSHIHNRLEAIQNILTKKDGFLDSLAAANTGAVYVSVVRFDKNAQTVSQWMNIKESSNLQTVKDQINGIQEGNGTNIHGGLMLGRNRLAMDEVKNTGAKYLCLLSDGAPYASSRESSSTDYIAGSNGGDNSTPAKNIAASIRESGTQVYTIGYGTTTAENDLLKNIAGSDSRVFSGTDSASVNAAFANVAQSAVEGMTGAGTSVTDPMGKFVVLGDVSAQAGVTATDDGLIWNLNEDTLVSTTVSGNTTTYTYRLTYPVTLDTAAQGFREDTFYPANGYTYLSVGSKKIAFNVPGIAGTAPQAEYRVEYYLQGDAAAGEYDAYAKAEEWTGGPVKVWTTVGAPAGYATKFDHYAFAAGQTSLQVTPNGENAMKLYYNRITAQVQVNHFYKTDVVNAAGVTTPGSYPATAQASATEFAYEGAAYTAVAQNVFGNDLYALVSADPSQEITVSADGNVINLYYSRTLYTYDFSVIYDGNGGILADSSATYGDSENTAEIFDRTHNIMVDENTFARENHTFIGWADETGKTYTAGQVVTLTVEDPTLVLYAQWQENEKFDYQVIYNANFGAEPETKADTDSVFGTYATTHTVLVDSNTFERPNHIFLGWAEAPGGAVVYQPGNAISFERGGSKTLYAIWQENAKYSYSVTYMGNGGALMGGAESRDDAENAANVYDTSYAITLDANDFLRANHTFVGWAEAANGPVVYQPGSTIRFERGGSKVLYAIWLEDAKHSYTVTYIGNGGTLADGTVSYGDSENAIDIYPVSHSISVDANTFVRENHSFIGWADVSGSLYTAGQVATLTAEDPTLVLYAQWEQDEKFSYEVIYNANFGTKPATKTDAESLYDTFATSHTITVDNIPFVRSGYTFIGWAESPYGPVVYQTRDIISFQQSGSITLYARWLERSEYSYSVIYNGNGGQLPTGEPVYGDEENVSGVTVRYHTIRVNENTFVRDNHVFIGWADANGKVYAAEELIALNASNNTLTLYAQWLENEKFDYQVIYNANFGAEPQLRIDAESINGIYEASHSIRVDANTFVRENFVFLGWNDKADGTGKVYTVDEVISLTAEDNNRTLYAQWAPASYGFTVVYLVRVDGDEYTVFQGALPENAPTGGQADYGAVIDETVLFVPQELTDDVLTYQFTRLDGITVTEGENVIFVYYTAELEEIEDPDVPLVDPPQIDPPKTGDPVLVGVGLALLSGSGVGVLLLKKKEDDTEE